MLKNANNMKSNWNKLFIGAKVEEELKLLKKNEAIKLFEKMFFSDNEERDVLATEPLFRTVEGVFV